MRRLVVFSLVFSLALMMFAACRGTGTTNSTPAAAQGAAKTAEPAGDPNAFTGTVAETMNSGGYTYARLQAPGKEDVWIAAREFQTAQGDRLTVGLDMPMQNFESKTLKRTFPLVYFVGGVTRDGQRLDAPAGMPGEPAALMTSHAPAAAPVTVEPVAPAAGGIAIADVWAKRTALAGQTVTVRGKVVKLNEQILGRNWIHLQDGSGSAESRTNDLTVTTADAVKLGDVITVAGVLAIDKDFGAGYAYAAILENAKVSK